MGPRRRTIRHRAYIIFLPLIRKANMLPHLYTYLSSPSLGCGCLFPDTEVSIFFMPVSLIYGTERCRSSKRLCASTDHACCFHITERGGVHDPWRRRATGS
ncbi:hypothetical protein ATANTOWER_003724 [Ataeniobius toweri]|uniref:Uncharacterized protein n=1 Tax=Ataeniobius toweri TaxID=208326 RepID=A0ABU7C7L9_9TELE|nr:hypothetical protein [Ataeniobius toweri]